MKSTRSKSRRRMLGLAVGEKSILIAEVSACPGASASGNGDGPCPFEATHLAEFVFPKGVTLQESEKLGVALFEFLKQTGITAHHAVIGIPAKWVVVKPKQVPPAEPAVIADSLRLQAEGDFSQAFADLVYDYAGQTSTSESCQVLLMATQRRYVDQVLTVSRTARLEVASVTPSAASLGWATNRSSREAMVLSLGASGAEFTAQSGTGPCVLRHLGPVPPNGPGPMFLSELRRTASIVPAPPPFAKAVDGTEPPADGNGKSVGRELVVWNGFSLDKSARQAVCESLGMPVRAGDLAALGVSSSTATGAAQPGHFAPAVALALSGMADTEESTGVDFLHSRLAIPPKPLVDRRIVWGVGIGLAALLLGAFALHQQHAAQAEVTAEKAKYSAIEPRFKLASAEVDKIKYARDWQGGQPKFIACLRDLTIAMPDDGQTYLTSFDLHEVVKGDAKGGTPGMKGQLTGKSTASDDHIHAIRNQMTKSGFFQDVNVSLSARDTRNGREVTFSIKFTYVGKD